MTVCTQQANVSRVGGPVGEAAAPRVSGLVSNLFGAVDVVNVERPKVVKPAQDTLSTKGRNESKFALPVSWCLVNNRAVLIPILSSAFWCAETVRAILAAVGARLVCAPPSGKVAGLAAILSGPVFEAVGVHRRGVPAMRARYLDWLGSLFSHGVTVPYYSARTKNLDSDAYRQPRLFKDEPPKPKQEALL
jgi:hypothetical protein